jgi:hypothetical protein
MTMKKRNTGEFETLRTALNEIHAVLDGAEWDSDTPDLIAEIIKGLGYKIRSPDEAEDCGE